MQLTFNPLDHSASPRARTGLVRYPHPDPCRTAPATSTLAFYAVDVVVSGAEEDVLFGEDRVDLTHQALDIVTTRSYPQVAGMRAPARFPKLHQMAQLRS